jgi:hypothetical protein
MFYFAVKHLRWLARVPGLPIFFDALLLASISIFRQPRLRAMEQLEAQALRLPNVFLKLHRFGGIEFVDKDTGELGHLHGHGLLDVPVGKEAARSLLANGKVRPHHVFPDSKWVSLQLESEADVTFALELLRMAADKR